MNSPWCHNFDAPSFVINGPKLAELEKIDLANKSVISAKL